MMFFLILIMANGRYHYSVRRELMFPKKDRLWTNGRPCIICKRGIWDHPTEHWDHQHPAFDSDCPFRYVSILSSQLGGSGDQ